jgi:hypothetical protein
MEEEFTIEDLRKLIEQQERERYRPDLLNAWMDENGKLYKFDRIDYHELWGIEYLSEKLDMDFLKVKDYLKRRYNDTSVLRYFLKLGWVKITQWPKYQDKISATYKNELTPEQLIELKKLKINYRNLKIFPSPI